TGRGIPPGAGPAGAERPGPRCGGGPDGGSGGAGGHAQPAGGTRHGLRCRGEEGGVDRRVEEPLAQPEQRQPPSDIAETGVRPQAGHAQQPDRGDGAPRDRHEARSETVSGGSRQRGTHRGGADREQHRGAEQRGAPEQYLPAAVSPKLGPPPRPKAAVSPKLRPPVYRSCGSPAWTRPTRRSCWRSTRATFPATSATRSSRRPTGTRWRCGSCRSPNGRGTSPRTATARSLCPPTAASSRCSPTASTPCPSRPGCYCCSPPPTTPATRPWSSPPPPGWASPSPTWRRPKRST